MSTESDPRVCACGLEKTTVATRAYVCANKEGYSHVLCDRCVADGRSRKRCRLESHARHTVVCVGSLMGQILSHPKSPHEPFFPGNVAFIPADKPWTTARAEILERSDFTIQIDRNSKIFSSVSRFFEEIGTLSIDVAAGQIYECTSDKQETVLLYDKEKMFAAKFTFCFTSDAKTTKFSVVPIVWLPEFDSLHQLTITVTPTYKFVWLITPLRFRPVLSIPPADAPQPPRGFFVHTLRFTLEQFEK